MKTLSIAAAVRKQVADAIIKAMVSVKSAEITPDKVRLCINPLRAVAEYKD
jgi:hypothetical protein